MTKITNVSQATQGVQSANGVVFIRPGETQDVLLHDSESPEGLSISPHLSVEGFDRPNYTGRTLGDMNQPGVARLDDDAREREEYIEQLEQELTTAKSEAASLKDGNAQYALDLEEARAQIVQLENARDGVTSGLVAKHKGAGAYSIYDASGTEVLTKLTGDQSKDFNSLPDDRAKTQWVKDHTTSAEGEQA